ncbi:unnamed protein product [Chironomus riparius]|uniref:RRM domain-containing protein n=1 Tax=Chironomus riparius TaxID=315576 RepID=A0A9P0IXY8_9DIPT|nr:unnamed protein product [Chironomus riparius]
MYNKMNGYNNFRGSRNGRFFSHSLPSGIDTDFTSTPYSARARMYDLPSSSTFGAAPHHHMSSSSTSSLTGIGLSGPSTSAAGAQRHNDALTNLIVNYLPQDLNERELHSLFSPMGPVETCRVMRDFKTGYSYGFAFINFINEESASRAIKCLNGYTIRGKRLKVSYARPQGEDLRETNLYITNLPRTITEQQLDVIFGKYGQIVQKNILRDKLTGQPRGVAFVRYNKREEAQEAIASLNNVIPQGGNQPLIVRVAEEHGRAKAALFLPQYNQFVQNRGRMRVRNQPY